MNKADLLLKYPDQEDKLLISKILDKIKFCKSKNKLTNTNFLDMREQALVNKLLANIKFSNFIACGGFDNAERKCFIFYPDKFNSELVTSNINHILHCIRISLPKELYNTYTHKNYLRRNYETWNRKRKNR